MIGFKFDAIQSLCIIIGCEGLWHEIAVYQIQGVPYLLFGIYKFNIDQRLTT